MRSGVLRDGAMVMGTWNTGSLLGGLRSVGRRQTVKRGYLRSLLEEVDFLAFQEVRGCEADLSVLPETHEYYGLFMAAWGPGTSAGGGIVLAIRKQILRRADEMVLKVISRSRIIVVSVKAGCWSHFAAIHIDPGQTMCERQRDLGKLAHFLDQSEGISYMLGDWNFVHASDSRMTGSGIERGSNDCLGPFFEGAFPEFVEWVQHDYTFRRMARRVGVETLFSRIERVYCNAHPTAYEDFLIQVVVRGAWEGRRTASDHLAVVARVVLRRGRGRRQVQPRVCMHESFAEMYKDEFRVYQDIQDSSIRHKAIVMAAHVCQQRVRRRLRCGLSPAPQVIVDACLSTFRLLRQSRHGEAAELVADVASLADCVDAEGVNAIRLGERMQSAINDAVTAELVELERSAMPEEQKTSKRKRIKVRLDPYRLRRKRISLDAFFSRGRHGRRRRREYRRRDRTALGADFRGEGD